MLKITQPRIVKKGLQCMKVMKLCTYLFIIIAHHARHIEETRQAPSREMTMMVDLLAKFGADIACLPRACMQTSPVFIFHHHLHGKLGIWCYREYSQDDGFYTLWLEALGRSICLAIHQALFFHVAL